MFINGDRSLMAQGRYFSKVGVTILIFNVYIYVHNVYIVYVYIFIK